jgi:hypothetical protein
LVVRSASSFSSRFILRFCGSLGIIFVIAGSLSDYSVGLIVEREFGGQVSLLVFLALYFAVLWLAWQLAVRATKPKRAAPAARG